MKSTILEFYALGVPSSFNGRGRALHYNLFFGKPCPKKKDFRFNPSRA
jgi:hypothetical protein